MSPRYGTSGTFYRLRKGAKCVRHGKPLRFYDLSALLWIALILIATWLYGGPPDEARERRASLTRGVDNFLGNMGVPGIVEQYGGIYEDEEAKERIGAIFERLVPQAKAERDDLEYQITLLNSDVPNAFALPGGHTYITRGLIELLDSDDEVAGVLGHELVHTVKSHGSIAFGRDLGLLLAYDIVLDHVEEAERRRAAELARLGHALISTGYSRSAETEADTVGLHYAVAADFDPVGLIRALEKIERYTRERAPSAQEVPVYFRTHPLTEERVRHLSEEARRLGYDVYVPGDPVTEALRRLHDSEQTEQEEQEEQP